MATSRDLLKHRPLDDRRLDEAQVTVPLSRNSGQLLDELETYVHRHGTWPAAKGLELRQSLEAERDQLREALEHAAGFARIVRDRLVRAE